MMHRRTARHDRGLGERHECRNRSFLRVVADVWWHVDRISSSWMAHTTDARRKR
jgi:hypothetical protein